MYEFRHADGSVWYEVAEEIARLCLHEHPKAKGDLRNIHAVNTPRGQQGSFEGDVVFVRWSL